MVYTPSGTVFPARRATDLNQEAEIDGDEQQNIDADENGKGGMETLPLCDCCRHAQNKDERYRNDIERHLAKTRQDPGNA
jgi:hypothetical protein